MKLKEIFNIYKEGNSVDKLGIIGNIVTIVSAFFALIAAQLFSIKYLFEGTTYIKVSFLVITLGVSFIILYLCNFFLSLTKGFIKSLLLRYGVNIIFFGVMFLLATNIWLFILTFQ